MRARVSFEELLSAVAGRNKPARLALIDEYDKVRKTTGWHAARRWLEQAATQTATAAAAAIAEGSQEWVAERERSAGLTDHQARFFSGLTESQILLSARSIKERRELRARFRQTVALKNYSAGLVGGKPGQHKYAAPNEIEIRAEQKAKIRKWAEEHFIRHAQTVVPLLDLMARAPGQRFAELFTIVHGIQGYAEPAGLRALFLTLTAPSRMHPNPSKGKNIWDGTTPRQAASWIGGHWHRVLARLKKEHIEIAGIRVVEPHADACAHWHLMIWTQPEDAARVEEIIRQATPEWREDIGAKIVDIADDDSHGETGAGALAMDKEIGKATSYIFKYIAKNIDNGERGRNAVAADAWRSTWGIRAFQLFGIPSLKTWRHFRRLDKAPEDTLLAGAWRAAKRGDAHAFIGLSGGLCIARKDRPIDTREEVAKETDGTIYEKHIVAVNRRTGETKWQEVRVWEIIGKDEAKAIMAASEETIVAVIANDPRTPHSELLEDLIFGGAPPPDRTGEVFFAGEWFPF